MSFGRITRRLGDVLDRAFVERELLLRSNGKVTYLRLSRRNQMALAGGLVAASLYVSLTTFGLIAQVGSSSETARDGQAVSGPALAELALDKPSGGAGALSRSSVHRRTGHGQDGGPAIQAPRARDGEELRPLLAPRELAVGKLRRPGRESGPRSTRDPQTQVAYERGQELAQAASRLEVELAMLHEALVASSGSLEEVRRQRDFLRARVSGLERRLTEMSQTQEAILDRLTEQITYSIETFEQVLTMTGVELSELVSEDSLAPAGLALGGPFIPGDYLAEDLPDRSFQAGVALLDLQLGRFEGLQQVIRRVPLTAPLDHYTISSGFGTRTDPFNGKKARHDGIDLDAPLGTKVLSTGPGRVTFAGWRGRYGRMVEIDHGQGLRTRYAHLRKILVKVDQEVGHRQTIGLLGNSGRSTGPHLHYEVRVNERPRNPFGFIKAGKYLFKGG